MRKDELIRGVSLRDENGNEYGKSIAAAKQGIFKCCFARFLWNIPALGLHPLVMDR